MDFKKNSLRSLFSMMMVAMISICLLSCGDDDDSNGNSGGSNTDMQIITN